MTGQAPTIAHMKDQGLSGVCPVCRACQHSGALGGCSGPLRKFKDVTPTPIGKFDNRSVAPSVRLRPRHSLPPTSNSLISPPPAAWAIVTTSLRTRSPGAAAKSRGRSGSCSRRTRPPSGRTMASSFSGAAMPQPSGSDTEEDGVATRRPLVIARAQASSQAGMAVPRHVSGA